MTKRIFRSIFTVAIIVFLSSVAIFLGITYSYFSSVQHNQLKMQTELVAQGVENEGICYFDNLSVDNYRITWIDKLGNVLYDSSTNSSEMENHLKREEVKQAFSSGYGESTRYSDTIMERSLYSALLLSDGTVIRLSIAQSSIFMLIIGMAQPLAILFVIAITVSFLLAARLAKRIVNPLNNLDLDHPLENDEYEEINPLLQRISYQQSEIKSQRFELLKKKSEFVAVTSCMNEGIILLNKEYNIISVNNAAKNLLDLDNIFLEKNIFTINHSIEIQNVIGKASEGIASETKIHLKDEAYQLNASPVISNDEIFGIVLLVFDITEKEKSEQMRREFTANVSHELKTPLHTISGCAELLKNNIVKVDDIPKFSQQIYTEAQRMIALVEDIIKLSHLDEGAEDLKKEDVDLLQIARTVAFSLNEEAKSADVTVVVTGENLVINGIPQLLNGIIYNLCDNAIKYNRKGGSVTIDVTQKENTVVLSVSDTGIGIPSEHQNRIFERFYRIDKSRSKSVGGTGLGLSIVKHAASLHNAQIEIHSIVDAGTTVKIIFPI